MSDRRRQENGGLRNKRRPAFLLPGWLGASLIGRAGQLLADTAQSLEETMGLLIAIPLALGALLWSPMAGAADADANNALGKCYTINKVIVQIFMTTNDGAVGEALMRNTLSILTNEMPDKRIDVSTPPSSSGATNLDEILVNVGVSNFAELDGDISIASIPTFIMSARLPESPVMGGHVMVARGGQDILVDISKMISAEITSFVRGAECVAQ